MTNEKSLEESQITEVNKMSDTLSLLVTEYFKNKGKTPDEIKIKLFLIKSIIYGAVIQTESSEISNIEEAMKTVKNTLIEILTN